MKNGASKGLQQTRLGMRIEPKVSEKKEKIFMEAKRRRDVEEMKSHTSGSEDRTALHSAFIG